jgi:hypothetical protein
VGKPARQCDRRRRWLNQSAQQLLNAIFDHMHTCVPPRAELRRWFRDRSVLNARYGHLLLEQQVGIDDALVAALRPYFESAHMDAREVFHEYAGIDLHPDAGAAGTHAEYPQCLPTTARRGLFGEVLAGLIAQGYEFVGNQQWQIPVFLLRWHADVQSYIFDLARDPARARQVFGRFGDDFIAIALDAGGSVTELLAGESKWRSSITPAEMEELMLGEWVDREGVRVRSGKGVWSQVSRGLRVPSGLRQLQQILRWRAPDDFAAAILSMDRALTMDGPVPLPRTDYVIIAGNAGERRRAGDALLPTAAAPPEYTGGRKLQVVEVVLEGGNDLIDRLYDTLWAGGDAAP